MVENYLGKIYLGKNVSDENYLGKPHLSPPNITWGKKTMLITVRNRNGMLLEYIPVIPTMPKWFITRSASSVSVFPRSQVEISHEIVTFKNRSSSLLSSRLEFDTAKQCIPRQYFPVECVSRAI